MLSSAGPYVSGMALGLGLIVAIGAQNAFVLRQGVRREHVLLVTTLCALIDISLIAVGALGFGGLIAGSELLRRLMAWGGAAFLLVYALLAFRAALRPGTLEATPDTTAGTGLGAREAALTTLAVSLLNPHVYLDTVVLLGGISAQYPPLPRLWFALGAASGSLAWFYGLGYGAAVLAPLFRRPLAWRLLDLGVGLVMVTIALGLLRGLG